MGDPEYVPGEPTPLGEPPVPIEASLPDQPFKIRVFYVVQTGGAEEYIGNFRSRNLQEAMQRAREFVIKYKRPSSITEVQLMPSTE